MNMSILDKVDLFTYSPKPRKRPDGSFCGFSSPRERHHNLDQSGRIYADRVEQYCQEIRRGLKQDGTEVRGVLNQRDQEVGGSVSQEGLKTKRLNQLRQKVNKDIVQNDLEVSENVYQDGQECRNLLQKEIRIDGDLNQKDQTVEGYIDERGQVVRGDKVLSGYVEDEILSGGFVYGDFDVSGLECKKGFEGLPVVLGEFKYENSIIPPRQAELLDAISLEKEDLEY